MTALVATATCVIPLTRLEKRNNNNNNNIVKQGN